MTTEVEFEFCDFNNPDHLVRLAELIEHYMADPMGGSLKPLTKIQQLHMVDGLNNHPKSFILFLIYKNDVAGLATCFENFSTFQSKPYINLHDIIVDSKYRGKGFGKMLMEEVIRIAEERKCCKVTLEVREDNYIAQTMYIDLGFADSKPKMYFWTKNLN